MQLSSHSHSVIYSVVSSEEISFKVWVLLLTARSVDDWPVHVALCTLWIIGAHRDWRVSRFWQHTLLGERQSCLPSANLLVISLSHLLWPPIHGQ